MTEKQIDSTFTSIDLRKPIQVRTGDYRRKWVEAKVVHIRADKFPEDYDEDLKRDECTRFGLSFSVEFVDDDEKTYEQHVADAFGWGSDNWRYKEKCCEQCKWVDMVGGDIVPYGATTARTPEGYTCECPDMPDDIEVPYDETNGGRECQYHEFPANG